jgi:hypothetical protein
LEFEDSMGMRSGVCFTAIRMRLVHAVRSRAKAPMTKSHGTYFAGIFFMVISVGLGWDRGISVFGKWCGHRIWWK